MPQNAEICGQAAVAEVNMSQSLEVAAVKPLEHTENVAEKDHQKARKGLSDSKSEEKFAQSGKSTLHIILAEIGDLKCTKAHEIAVLQERLTKIKEAMTLIPERLKEAESRISNLEDNILSMQQEVSRLESLLENK
ncbi:hypothetical protein NDU88_001855 [Pleurodeles waltl]|uniref:Myotonic dystrophy protein kinase coiled coil domain-containing protein n=1 Tax=Pleurodeles waltl TaxID=8319 RepID=A0AAV7WPW9_PLEWA|nr:hypothetical protein NDU88_001855 [Pleurodeles waltl]